MSAIFDLLHNELFRATTGQGAFLNDEPIHTAKSNSLQQGIMGFGVSHRVKPETFTPVLHQILLDGGMFIRNGSGALMPAYVPADEVGEKPMIPLQNNELINVNYILAACSEAVSKRLLNIKNTLTEKR